MTTAPAPAARAMITIMAGGSTPVGSRGTPASELIYGSQGEGGAKQLRKNRPWFFPAIDRWTATHPPPPPPPLPLDPVTGQPQGDPAVGTGAVTKRDMESLKYSRPGFYPFREDTRPLSWQRPVTEGGVSSAPKYSEWKTPGNPTAWEVAYEDVPSAWEKGGFGASDDEWDAAPSVWAKGGFGASESEWAARGQDFGSNPMPNDSIRDVVDQTLMAWANK